MATGIIAPLLLLVIPASSALAQGDASGRVQAREPQLRLRTIGPSFQDQTHSLERRERLLRDEMRRRARARASIVREPPESMRPATTGPAPN